MRLTDPDRERLYALLSEHAARGELELAELERRVAVVAEAETYDEALAALAGLSAAPSGFEPPPRTAPWGRGHGDSDRARAGWSPTDERFRDPTTRRVMRVWIDRAGQRHYVPED